MRSWRPARKSRFIVSGKPLEDVSARRQHLLRYFVPIAAGAFVLLSPIVYFAMLINGSRHSEASISDLLNIWPGTLLLWIPGAAIYYLASRNQGYYVGATWITERYQILDDNESRLMLNMYELAKIEIRRARSVDATLLMVNHKKDELEAPLGLLEGNPNLWDYVYNGLVHSAANGAEVDPLTRELLHFPGPGVDEGNSMSNL